MEHLMSWIPSTNLQDDYSDGQSLIAYTRRWDQKIRNKTVAEYDLFFEFDNNTASQVRFTISGPADTVMTRFLGCFVISNIPENGLTETLQCLKNIWEFYSEKELAQNNSERLTTKLLKAAVAGKEKRPDLILSE